MRKRKRLTENIIEIEEAMKVTQSKAEFQRLQSIYLADTRPHMTAEEIGEIVGYKTCWIKEIHSNFRKNGMDSIKDKRGGRYRENMTIEEEKRLLSEFEEQSKSGKLVVAGKIKARYEEKVGKEVAESTIYRMLDRHGFRKIVPYKRHPKADKEAQDAFKKTSPI